MIRCLPRCYIHRVFCFADGRIGSDVRVLDKRMGERDVCKDKKSYIYQQTEYSVE